MMEEISVPADDKFQIITSHQANEINIPKSYLGIEYTQGIVFIQITLNAGRTVELKKKFYQRIANDLHLENVFEIIVCCTSVISPFLISSLLPPKTIFSKDDFSYLWVIGKSMKLESKILIVVSYLGVNLFISEHS
jgi:hypothetical protein